MPKESAATAVEVALQRFRCPIVPNAESRGCWLLGAKFDERRPATPEIDSTVAATKAEPVSDITAPIPPIRDFAD